jgi:hypothetical protein
MTEPLKNNTYISYKEGRGLFFSENKGLKTLLCPQKMFEIILLQINWRNSPKKADRTGRKAKMKVQKPQSAHQNI